MLWTRTMPLAPLHMKILQTYWMQTYISNHRSCWQAAMYVCKQQAFHQLQAKCGTCTEVRENIYKKTCRGYRGCAIFLTVCVTSAACSTQCCNCEQWSCSWNKYLSDPAEIRLHKRTRIPHTNTKSQGDHRHLRRSRCKKGKSLLESILFFCLKSKLPRRCRFTLWSMLVLGS